MTGTITDTSSFEADVDEWTTSTFLRKAGSTGSTSTGPLSAADGSYYVYCETSSPNFPGVNFDLEKTFSAGQELYGIAFQYHMYGGTMGSAVLESDSPAPAPAAVTVTIGNSGGFLEMLRSGNFHFKFQFSFQLITRTHTHARAHAHTHTHARARQGRFCCFRGSSAANQVAQITARRISRLQEHRLFRDMEIRWQAVKATAMLLRHAVISRSLL